VIQPRVDADSPPSHAKRFFPMVSMPAGGVQLVIIPYYPSHALPKSTLSSAVLCEQPPHMTPLNPLKTVFSHLYPPKPIPPRSRFLLPSLFSLSGWETLECLIFSPLHFLLLSKYNQPSFLLLPVCALCPTKRGWLPSSPSLTPQAYHHFCALNLLRIIDSVLSRVLSSAVILTPNQQDFFLVTQGYWSTHVFFFFPKLPFSFLDTFSDFPPPLVLEPPFCVSQLTLTPPLCP